MVDPRQTKTHDPLFKASALSGKTNNPAFMAKSTAPYYPNILKGRDCSGLGCRPTKLSILSNAIGTKHKGC